MALTRNIYKTNCLMYHYVLLNFGNKWLQYCVRRHGTKSVTLDSDCIDEFTTQLIERKSSKWEKFRAKRIVNYEKECWKPNAQDLACSVEYSNKNKLDVLLKDAIYTNNISLLENTINECTKHKVLPTTYVLLQTMIFCSQNGDKDMIINIAALCNEIQPKLIKDHSNFEHYLAKAIWIKGDYSNAIIIFEKVYRNNLHLRQVINFMLKDLLSHTVVNRSEAALFNMIDFADCLIEDFNDFYPMSCIWQACFLSEWFTDQSIALKLLEEKVGLLQAISNQLPFVVTQSLSRHQTDTVYRLLELLLTLKHTPECSKIVGSLFDYQVFQGDIRGCSEIIKWAIKQDIDIQVFKHQPFINLLLSYVSDPALAALINIKSKQLNKYDYQFKF